MVDLSEIHARELAERMLARGIDRLEAFRPRCGGFDSSAFRVWAGRDAMLLKVMKRPGTPVGVYMHRRLEEAGIPVPALYAFSPDAGPGGRACAIWEWVEGTPVDWPPGARCPYDEAEIGALLRRIHELSFAGPFGFLGDDLANRSFSWSPYLGPTSGTWRGFFNLEGAGRRLAEQGHLTLHEAGTMAALPGRVAGALSEAPCRLLHTDLRNNLILDPDSARIRAVFDYTESCAGDPRWELAYFDYWFVQRTVHPLPFAMERFRAAYGDDHDPEDELGRFYLAAILAVDEIPGAGPSSPNGKWAVSKLKSVIRTFGD